MVLRLITVDESESLVPRITGLSALFERNWMYAKVFAQILDSSIAENYSTRHVFMDFLVLADKDGMVDMTAQAISRRTNVPLELIETAIEKLSTPDVDSRSSAEGGRRIVLIDPDRGWGWKIVNYVNYCKLRDETGRKEYMRDYMRRRRESEKVSAQDVDSIELLTPVNTCKPPLAHVPVPIAVKTNTKTRPQKAPVASCPFDWIEEELWKSFWAMREGNRWKTTEGSMKGIVDKLEKFHSMGLDCNEILQEAIIRNWRGLFEINHNGGNNGENRQSPTKQRVDAARSRLAQAAIDRGLLGIDRPDGELGAPLPLTGFRRQH